MHIKYSTLLNVNKALLWVSMLKSRTSAKCITDTHTHIHPQGDKCWKGRNHEREMSREKDKAKRQRWSHATYALEGVCVGARIKPNTNVFVCVCACLCVWSWSTP